VSDGGGGDVDDSLEQEAALGIDVDRLTADAPETRRHLNVHRQLQAEVTVTERMRSPSPRG